MKRLQIAMIAGFALLGTQFLAGWARLPLSIIPALAGVAVLHILLTRHRGVWRDPARFAGVVAINLAVAGFLYAAGAGLAAAAGPLALSALTLLLIAGTACAIAALAWSPRNDAALDGVLRDSDR